MSKVFMIVFVIFGTVVGSGFASGKEIMVYFSRFGQASYFYIALAGILFFFLFHFFLSKGSKIVKHMEKSHLLNAISLFISFIFAASMFAGIKNLFSYFPTWAYVLLGVIVLACCFFATLKGLKGLEKINLILMPAASFLFLIVLIFCTTLKSNFEVGVNPAAGVVYSPLYVALNTCMSGLVISKVGENLNKKQVTMACVLSTLLLLLFLFLGNFVLQQNGESYYSEMPFLYLTSKNKFMFVFAYVVILIGCITTLISLCYTIKSAIGKIVKNNFVSTSGSIFVPLAFSGLGFSQIVSLIYPFCSVLGIFMLLYIIFAEIKFRN